MHNQQFSPNPPPPSQRPTPTSSLPQTPSEMRAQLEAQLDREDPNFGKSFIKESPEAIYAEAKRICANFVKHISDHDHPVENCDLAILLYRSLRERRWPDRDDSYYEGLFSAFLVGVKVVDQNVKENVLLELTGGGFKLYSQFGAFLTAAAFHWRRVREGISVTDWLEGDEEEELDKLIDQLNS